MNVLVEQVKGSEEMKEKIIAASREARLRADYPHELLPDYFNPTICDKFLNNYHETQIHQSNGKSNRNISMVIKELHSGCAVCHLS